MSKYEWREGIPKPPVSAEVFGEVVERIEAMRGAVKAADIVEEAARPGSPIRDLFEWRDEKAAESFRRDQARHYLRSLVIVRVKTKEGPTVSHRAYYVTKQDDKRGYRGVTRIMSDADLKAQVLDEAKRELESFVKKFSSIIALSAYLPRLNEVIDGMRDDIDQMRVEATRRRAAAQPKHESASEARPAP